MIFLFKLYFLDLTEIGIVKNKYFHLILLSFYYHALFAYAITLFYLVISKIYKEDNSHVVLKMVLITLFFLIFFTI